MDAPPVDNAEVERLLRQFVEWVFKGCAALEKDNFRADKVACVKRSAIAKQLETLVPDGRRMLLPLLQHPDVAVRCYAAVYLTRSCPEQARPVLQRIADMPPSEEFHAPHALFAARQARMTLSANADGYFA